MSLTKDDIKLAIASTFPVEDKPMLVVWDTPTTFRWGAVWRGKSIMGTARVRGNIIKFTLPYRQKGKKFIQLRIV